jgi:hypothetical protein
LDRKRRLILLLDGTWNDVESGNEDTNIVRLRDIFAHSLSGIYYSPISIDEVLENDSPVTELGIRSFGDFDYLFFYERGVGTGPGWDRLTGGALGWGLGRNIQRAYKFLSRNYLPGTEIFIFGFSRGAYTARSLVGYLGSSGLLMAEHCDSELERRAWSNYRTAPNDRLPATKIGLQPYVHSFGQLRVSCLGVFDTVGALGIPTTVLRRLNREFYEFHDVELSPIVRLNLHALAIDEHRQPFAASVWRQSRFRWSNSVTEQTWFPGVHADVGGGYASDGPRNGVRNLDEVSLDWMIKRLRHHYPDFPSLDASFSPMSGEHNFGTHHESRAWHYRVSAYGLRTIGNMPMTVTGRKRVVSYDRSETVVGEAIHISALERLACNAPYRRSSNAEPYLPHNVIEALPNLYERYCVPQTRSWGPEAISITAWSGEICHESESSSETLQKVRSTIIEACERLRRHNIEIVPQSV